MCILFFNPLLEAAGLLSLSSSALHHYPQEETARLQGENSQKLLVGLQSAYVLNVFETWDTIPELGTATHLIPSLMAFRLPLLGSHRHQACAIIITGNSLMLSSEKSFRVLRNTLPNHKANLQSSANVKQSEHSKLSER